MERNIGFAISSVVNKKVVLGYTGKLDTEIALYWLSKIKKYEVYACSIQIGQQEYLNPLGEQAIDGGARSSYVIDLKNEFANNYVCPAIFAQVIYESGYNLCHALSRPLIAKELIRYAYEEGITKIALGCRGLGNDHIRFEKCINALSSDFEIIFPLKELKLKNIEDDKKFAKEHKLGNYDEYVDIDQNIFGRTISLSDNLYKIHNMPGNVFFWVNNIQNAPEQPIEVVIEFRKGIPVKLNKERLPSFQILENLNILAGKCGIGKIFTIENSLLGRKIYECYEIPASIVLYKAIEFLKELVFNHKTLQIDRMLSGMLSALIYTGDWFSSATEGILAFYKKLRKYVNGEITLELFKGNINIKKWKIFE
ncbi:MAG: argininosuccinate synthase [Planctomycetota bacterium]